MKPAENTELLEQSYTRQRIDAGQMNSAGSSSTGGTLAVEAERAAPDLEMEREGLSSFFIVGIVINLVMITAYFIWAYKQWNKSGASDE